MENKLDKIMIKYNEAQSIRKTYEQIVKRLKEERIGYDNQLAAIERSLKGKEHDFVELVLLSHDATHAKELAESELKKYFNKKKAVKLLREKYIEEKKKQLNSRRELMKKQQQRKEQERQKKDRKLHDKRSAREQTNNQYETEQQKQNNMKNDIQDYKEGFEKLHEATGVNDVNEIIQKYITQGETMKSLEDLKKSHKEKIKSLRKQRDDLKKELDVLKFEKADAQTRKQIDEVKD